MPVFIFVSMVFHALLFLYAPQMITGLSPGLQKGDTEGLTFVTIIDVPEAIRPEAPRAEQVTPPRSMPNPEPQPTPQPQPPAETRVDVTPPTPVVPDVQAVISPPAPPVVEEPIRAPVVEAPAAPTPPEVVAERPEPAPPVLTAPRGVEVTPAESAPPSPVQAVISTPPRPEPVAQEVRPPTSTPEPQVVETLAPPTPTPEPRVVETVTPPPPPPVVEREGPEEPGAITAAEPAPVTVAPPTGDTMAQAAGQFVYPKQAVDLLSQTVAVEVAVVVSTNGDVLDVVVVQSSGLAQIDEHASLLARHGMDYNAYDDVYELRVFVTYNHGERLMTQEVSDFFQSPPTVNFSPN